MSRSRTTYFMAKMEFDHIMIALAAQLKNCLDFNIELLNGSIWLIAEGPCASGEPPFHFECSMDPFL